MPNPLSSTVLPPAVSSSSSHSLSGINDEQSGRMYDSPKGAGNSFSESMRQVSSDGSQRSSPDSGDREKDSILNRSRSEIMGDDSPSLPLKSDAVSAEELSVMDVSDIIGNPTVLGQDEHLSLLDERQMDDGVELGYPQVLGGVGIIEPSASDDSLGLQTNIGIVMSNSASPMTTESGSIAAQGANLSDESGLMPNTSILSPLQSTTQVDKATEVDMLRHQPMPNAMQLKLTRGEVNQPSLNASQQTIQLDSQTTELNLKGAYQLGVKQDDVVSTSQLLGNNNSSKSRLEIGLTSDTALFLDKVSTPDARQGRPLADLSTELHQASTSLLGSTSDASLSQSAAALSTGRASVPMTMSFSHPQWGTALAEKAAWAVSQNIQSVEIQLDPPELGPLQIKVHVHQDQASVNFVSANPVVREALDQSMLRLKDMLQEQGMDLVDSGVSGESGQQSEQDQGGNSDDVVVMDSERAHEESSHQMNVVVPSGIDYFA